MNKEFEKEYQEYSMKDTPDLWGRIEAGIDEIENGTDAAEKITPIETGKKKHVFKYSGWVAAAACLLIAIPAILKMSSDNAVLNMATATVSENEAMVVAEAAINERDVADATVPIFTEAYVAASSEMEAPSIVAAPSKWEKAANSGASLKEQPLPMEAMAEVAVDHDISDGSERKPSLTARYAEADDLLEKCNVITISSEEPVSKVMLFPGEELTDFEVLKISITGVTDKGEVLYESKALYSMELVTPDEPVLIELKFYGDMPEYAVSFTDASGSRQVMSISMSGYDGSIVLSPL